MQFLHQMLNMFALLLDNTLSQFNEQRRDQ